MSTFEFTFGGKPSAPLNFGFGEAGGKKVETTAGVDVKTGEGGFFSFGAAKPAVTGNTQKSAPSFAIDFTTAAGAAAKPVASGLLGAADSKSKVSDTPSQSQGNTGFFSFGDKKDGTGTGLNFDSNTDKNQGVDKQKESNPVAEILATAPSVTAPVGGFFGLGSTAGKSKISDPPLTDPGKSNQSTPGIAFPVGKTVAPEAASKEGTNAGFNFGFPTGGSSGDDKEKAPTTDEAKGVHSGNQSSDNDAKKKQTPVGFVVENSSSNNTTTTTALPSQAKSATPEY